MAITKKRSVGSKAEFDGVVALAVDLVEQGQRAGAPVDRKGADQVSSTVHAVQAAGIARQSEQRRILQAAEMLQMGPAAAHLIDMIHIDAVSPSVPVGRGVSADIGKHVILLLSDPSYLPEPDP